MADPWTRKGQLVSPSDVVGSYRLLQAPCCWELSNGLLRIAVAARDEHNRAHAVCLDVDPEANMKIRRIDRVPTLSPERVPGATSIGLSSVVRLDDGRLRAYGAILWLTSRDYQISIFCAESDDEGATFSEPRIVLPSDRNNDLPVLSAFVVRSDAEWRMWYTAFESWRHLPGKAPDSRYGIRHARSADGLTWELDEGFALAWRSGSETGIISSSVVADGGQYEMWTSRRGPYSDADPSLRRYRIVRATSADGTAFSFDDAAPVFDPASATGSWENEMQCYPHLFRSEGRPDILLYCGNGYGATGIGWAVRARPR